MLQGVFLALGAGAFVLMLAATLLNLQSDAQLVFGLTSMLLWWLWAIQATEVTSVGPNGAVTESYTSLLFVGLVLGGVMALSNVMRLLDLFEDSL